MCRVRQELGFKTPKVSSETFEVKSDAIGGPDTTSKLPSNCADGTRRTLPQRRKNYSAGVIFTPTYKHKSPQSARPASSVD